MDELLKNYIKHIQVNFSAGLADDMNLILNRGLQNETPIEEIEINLQNRLCDHFRNLKSNEFEDTAKSLYEAYVDYDDENLIRSVRFLIRIYSKFLNLKLAKFFCDWRIKTMRIAQSQNLNKLDFNHQTDNLNNKKFDVVNEKKEKEIYFNKNKIDRMSRGKNDSINTFNENNNYDNDNQQKIDNKNNINNNIKRYGSKLNYNYNYDPCMNNFEKIQNDCSLNNQSYENIANRSIEEKYSKINIKADGDMHDYNSNRPNELKSQRINKNNDSVDENKNWSKPQIKKDRVKIVNNSFSNNKDTSLNSKPVSPSNIRKNNNFDYNRENSNSRLINNKEEKRMEMKHEKQRKEKNNSNSVTIFDKLFLESYKKSDEKLLNEEIKKLSELDECTFQPNVNNKRGIF